MKKTYIIAEIGINHNGDLAIAEKLIKIAAVCGCDAVKFQKRNPHVCVPEHQKGVMKQTPWGEMTYLDYKLKMEFDEKQFHEIDQYCLENDIAWSASVWDLDSLKFMEGWTVPFLKIPSAMLTNDELVSSAASFCEKRKIKLIISTGMSTVHEIDHAVNLITQFGGPHFALLHCNSTYPAPLNELNLSCIKTLKDRYKCEVGYSGHEFRLGTTVAATYLGASIIERHITLDRSMFGTDQLSSIEPQGLMKLVSGIRELEQCYGDGNIGVTASEMEVRKKLRG
jgi:N-acetylneuraminate synthase